MKKVFVGIFIVIIIFFIYFFIDLNKNKIAFQEVNIEIEENNNNSITVHNGIELVKALENDNIEIIEIANDIDLGYNVVNIKSKYLDCHNKPLTHPILKETGVSKLNIKNKENLIIYSKNGYRLLHTNIRITNSKNIKIDNLKFEELWEWDEESEARYEINDWDYITIINSENIQIKNCEFSKSYDGITDIKDSKNVTIEYCRYNEMDINDPFFSKQFDELEENINNYPMYKFLREDVGLSIDKIKELSKFQFKLYLIQPKEKDGKNENIIIHDGLYLNVKTRIPNARNSSVYLYNIYFDASKINYDMITKKEFHKIDDKYPKMVALSSYGPISLDRSYIVIENSFFNVKHLYTTHYEIKWSNYGKIIVNKELDDANKLKDKLEKETGNKNYE